MNIDFQLILKCQKELADLVEVADKKEMNKDKVFSRLQKVVGDMANLSSINKDGLARYREKFNAWMEQLDDKLRVIKEMTEEAKEANRLSDILLKGKFDEEWENASKKFDELNKRIDQDGQKYLEIISAEDLAKEVMKDYVDITFIGERKKELNTMKSAFRRSWNRIKFGSAAFASLLAFLAEELISKTWPVLSAFSCAALVFVATYYTTDRILSKKADTAHWQQIKKQVTILVLEFCKYTHQMNVILKAEAAKVVADSK